MECNAMRYELEQVMEIWNNDTGEHIAVGPDRDGLDMIEIRYYTAGGIIEHRIMFAKEQLPLVISALQSFT